MSRVADFHEFVHVVFVFPNFVRLFILSVLLLGPISRVLAHYFHHVYFLLPHLLVHVILSLVGPPVFLITLVVLLPIYFAVVVLPVMSA